MLSDTHSAFFWVVCRSAWCLLPITVRPLVCFSLTFQPLKLTMFRSFDFVFGSESLGG